jgi:hypothetical protein
MTGTFKESLFGSHRRKQWSAIAIAFALALATSAQATPLAPLHKDGMITQVREACGAGYHMVNGTCIRTAARRNAARCAVGMRTVGGRCVH